MISASLANSLGCSGGIGPPMAIQRVAPLRSHADAGHQHGDQPEDRGEHQQRADDAELAVVALHQHEHGHAAERAEEDLAQHEVVGVAELQQPEREAGAVDGEHAEDDEHADRGRDQVVGRCRP